MKRVVAMLMVAIMAVGLLAGCKSQNSDDVKENQQQSAETETSENIESDAAEETGAEVCLIMMSEGTIDDRGFYGTTYDGIKKFCEETGHTYTYYNTTEDSEDGLYQAVDMAIQNGAEVICVSGASFIGLMEGVFETYPDTLFICNEIANTEAADNSVMYSYRIQEATFLAGAAAVYEGYDDIGIICGQQIIPNMNGGYGFIQGVNWAAKELGKTDIGLKYWYSNSFVASPDIQTYAASWFESGTQMIAANCGDAVSSVYAAAEATGGKTMSPDTDQHELSESILTSFLKNLEPVTYEALKEWEEGNFPAGQNVSVGLTEGAVGLEMENERFENFSQEDLDAIIEKIDSGEIETIYDGNATEDPEELYNMLESQNINFTYYK